MHPSALRIDDFTYSLPDDRIALHPAAERDASKLLVYKNGIITDLIYKDIGSVIPQDSMLVFNRTKVVHARLLFRKETGSTIEIFCLEPAQNIDIQSAMLQKSTAQWKCLIGGAKKWRENTSLKINHTAPDFCLEVTLVEKHTAYYTVQLTWDNPELTFAEILHFAGKVPLPPYINRASEIKDENRYQTIFATDEGSVAAPTAALHFTPGILKELTAKDIALTYVTLHVGAGTFMPVKSDDMQGHEMHAEWIDVNKATIENLLHHKGKIIPVGTTSLRTIESLYHIGNKLKNGLEVDWNGLAVKQWDPYESTPQSSKEEALNAILTHLDSTSKDRIVTRTQILIAPGYTFKIAAGLITNFHQPQSTLLLLVSALIGDAWQTIYNHALNHNYRFLSYGDGSLLLP